MKFVSVHSVTPKAGLLTALAAFFAFIPHRIHIFTGQVWATKKGLIRLLLMSLDKIIFLLDNIILVDGQGQRQFLLSHHIISSKKSKVIGEGSICGVNTKRFYPTSEIRRLMRGKFNINDDFIVYEFMGRLNHDKGVYELLKAFNKLVETKNNVYLILFGDDEENCMKNFKQYENIKTNINFLYYGSTPIPEKMLQVGDVFCLPTYREGFGSSVIEASCLGLPVICSNAYGVMDAMVDNVTGLRCKVGDWGSLYNCMLQLYANPELRKKMGEMGRLRVLNSFSGEILTEKWVEFYNSIMINV